MIFGYLANIFDVWKQEPAQTVYISFEKINFGIICMLYFVVWRKRNKTENSFTLTAANYTSRTACLTIALLLPVVGPGVWPFSNSCADEWLGILGCSNLAHEVHISSTVPSAADFFMIRSLLLHTEYQRNGN